MFHFGQKVECIDDDFRAGFGGRYKTIYPDRLPFKGGIYEVCGFVPADRYGPEQILLAEFMEIYATERQPVSFNPRRFRPIDESKAKISFTTGAPKDSKKWDNRRKVRARARHVV